MFTNFRRVTWNASLAATIFALLAALLSGAVTYTSARATGPVYVKPNGMAGSCNSWANACPLQYALGVATSGSALWVMKGTYYPTSSADRTVSFVLNSLNDGVAIYGGFAGTETQLNQRDPVANVTTLSGDIGVAGDKNDNSYHVVQAFNGTSNTILDGFTIRDGNANAITPSPNNSGGGMYINGGSPSLVNVNFSGNSAGLGGGMFNDNSSPTLTNVTFSGNSASGGYGGGMFNRVSSHPTLTNVNFSGNSAQLGGGMFNDGNSNPTVTRATFSGNQVTVDGGGMYNDTSSPTLTNVTFSGNSASNYGGGMITTNNGSPSLKNVTFSGNTAASGGGMRYDNSTVNLVNVIIANNTGGGDCVNNGGLMTSAVNNLIEDASNACGLTNGVNDNITGIDPELGALANNGGTTKTMALNSGSPAIDAGKDADCPAEDQRGVVRPQRAHCDIGAYEAPATPASGNLDATFSWEGLVTSYIVPSNPGRIDVAVGIAIQPNDKIVAAGYSATGMSNSDFALTRYNPNGSLDKTFSGDGRLITNFGGYDQVLDIAVQSNGKIVVSGTVCNAPSTKGPCDVALARYNANGTLDTTFSGNGKQTTDFGGGDNGSRGGLAIQSDGKIVVAGYAWNGTDSDFAVYRYNANGSLDTSFSANGDGVAVGGFGAGRQDWAYDLVLQSDGKIVIAGATCDASSCNFAIVRLNSNGTGDTAFSGDGRQTTNFGGNDIAYGLALGPNGKIVVVGYKGTSSSSYFAIVRYNVNGSLDTTFSGTGKKAFSIIPGGQSSANDIIVQSNGNIVVLGSTDNGGAYDFALVRLKSGGGFDTTFSGDGKAYVSWGAASNDLGYAIALQPSDGKYVLGGTSGAPGQTDFALARVLP